MLRRMDGATAAAWAQAILTFAGIVASGWIAARVAALPILASRHQRLSALVCIVSAGVERLDRAQRLSDDYDDGVLGLVDDPATFDRVIEAIGHLPLLEISPGALVSGLLELRENLALARKLVADLQQVVIEGPVVARNNGARISPWLEAARGLESNVVEFAAEAARAERQWWLP
ncbi:MAG: hypothetical protein ACOY5Y_07090 [Pseudomonadota bacterium]